jgi:hypothetical protein
MNGLRGLTSSTAASASVSGSGLGSGGDGSRRGGGGGGGGAGRRVSANVSSEKDVKYFCAQISWGWIDFSTFFCVNRSSA